MWQFHESPYGRAPVSWNFELIKIRSDIMSKNLAVFFLPKLLKNSLRKVLSLYKMLAFACLASSRQFHKIQRFLFIAIFGKGLVILYNEHRIVKYDRKFKWSTLVPLVRELLARVGHLFLRSFLYLDIKIEQKRTSKCCS